MKKGFLKKLTASVLIVVLTLTAAGCAVTSDDGEDYYLFRLEEEGNSLEKTKLDVTGDASGDLTASLMDAVCAADADVLLPEDVEILGYSVSGGVLTIDFSAEYKQMEDVRELLCRAAIAETMLQSDSVEAVVFKVEGEPLTDDNGTEIGPMTDETFITNPAGQINSTQKATVVLYFTDSTGALLYPEQRTLHYFTSMSVEWMVVEHLIAGPQDESLSPTVPAETTIISVTTADGICYVNLDQTFLSNSFTVTGEIVIYSIVNSLFALDNGIESVQISVDGDSEVTLLDTVSLNRSFTMNDDLIADDAEPVETEVEEEIE